MKVRLTRFNREMRGFTYTLTFLLLSLLFALYWGIVSVSVFFYGYLTIFTASTILNHFRSDFVDLDESKLKELNR